MSVGLVLEGGANRTIFTSGVLDAMIENEVKTDYVIGVSAGIAYGVNYASWQKGRTLHIFNEFLHDKRYMGFKHMFKKDNRSFFNLDFTYDTIPNELIPFDYESFRKFPGDVEAVVTNLVTGNAEYMQVPLEDKGFHLLRATCALPLLFPPIILNGQPYMDGGLSDPIPYQRAFDKGVDKLILVLTREKEYSKSSDKFKRLIRFKYAKYPKLIELMESRPDIYNNQRKALFELEKDGKVLVLMPDSTKDFSRTEKDMSKIHSMYDSGYQKALNRIEEIKEFCNERG